MKRFLLYATLLVLLFCIPISVGEVIIRKQPNAFKIKRDYVLEHSKDVEIIILGTSHAFLGFKSSLVENSVNLAYGSQPLKYDFFMLDKFGSLCSNLKTVILPISYHTFFSDNLEEKETHCNINYKIYLGCTYYKGINGYSFEFCVPKLYKSKLLKIFKGTSLLDCDSLGWGNYNIVDTKSSDWDTNLAAVERQTTNDWSYLDDNIQYFLQMAEWCKQRGVQLILVTTPTYHTYYERLDSAQLAKTYELVHKYAVEYSLPYYDYLKDPRFDDQDFHDVDHLTDVGAEKFTRILKEDIFDEF